MACTSTDYRSFIRGLGFIEIQDAEACGKVGATFSHLVQDGSYMVVYGRDPIDNHRRTFVFDPNTGRFWTRPDFVRWPQLAMPHRDVTQDFERLEQRMLRIQRPRY